MSEQTFTRFVVFPSGSPGVTAKNLAVCIRSLANELDRLDSTKVKEIRIDPTERKLVVTLEGEDPRKGIQTKERRE